MVGSEGFDAHIDGIYAEVDALMIPAAMKATEFLRGHVAAQTPVETGNLVGSEEVRPAPDGAELFIPGPYARRQHYELSYHHNTGNALYLELPWMQHADEALKIIAEDLGEAMD
jgi:hypothetical protein